MAGLVPPAVLEQIRAASDIVDVIGAYLPLKRAGANFVTHCPFHKEKTPSFNVNPHRQIFHCFGCHKGGDVFTFVKEYESVTFIEAIRRLAQRANIPLEFEQAPGQQQARYLKETLLQMHEQITQRWQNALRNEASGQPAREYLARRGVTEEAVELFRLGFAPDAWDDTVNWAKSKGFDAAVAEQAGLIIRKPETGKCYDRFRGRLMFPIADEQGRVIAFSGRVLRADEQTAKYVNSPETPIFTKGKVFYGLDKSKRAILDAGFAVICEGQLDLIACYMAGVRNMVAPQGTAFTPDHARILKRYVDEVVLCFDSDNAGQKAAVRVFDSLLASGLAIRVATVPAPHDPDSFIKEQGGPAFQQLIARAEGFFDFYLNQLCASNDVRTDKGRLAVVKAMGEAVQKTGSPVLSDTYAQKTAQRLGVGAEAIRLDFRKSARAAAAEPAPAREPEEPAPAMAAPRPTEFWLLKLLLASEESLESVAPHLDLNWIEHPVIRHIVAARLEAHHRSQWQGVAAFLDAFEDSDARGLITEAASEQRPIPNPEATLKGDGGKKGVLDNLRDDYLDRQIRRLQQQIGQPALSDTEAADILREQAHCRELKRQRIFPPQKT